MADMLQAASIWLDGQRKSFMSHSVTYKSGAYSVAVQAASGKTNFQIDDGYGAIVDYQAQDFLILASDLVLNGAAALPKRGDTIVDVQGPAMLTYEVVAPGKEPDWRYTDSYRQTLRVHTKLIGKTP